MKASTRPLTAIAIVGLLLCTSAVDAQPAVVTAGANMDIDFNQEIPVGYAGFVGAYFLEFDLNHDPGAGPMIKRFESPVTDTLDRILLDATLPNPQPIREDINILPSALGGPVSVAVHDWHEEILTTGWEWVLPGDSRFPDLFSADVTLITRNGAPHPWTLSPTAHSPNELWLEFPPIQPGETLDIHKALLWVGTLGNRIWGDDVLDDGTAFDESVIAVWEYPTVPEPNTWSLLAVCTTVVAMVLRRRNATAGFEVRKT